MLLGRGVFHRYACMTSRCSSAVEHFLGKEEVSGSSPDIGSKESDVEYLDAHIEHIS